ncbi:MAG: host-nuclease inhibitor Gam family protein [Anaerotignaceae bacterium]
MGKKIEVELSSWEDVNAQLKQKGECEIAIDSIEAEMNLKINEIKAGAEKLAKPLKDRIKEIDNTVKVFAEENKADIEGKTKVLNFGRVGFRLSERIIASDKKMQKILENLKKFGMENCINVKETLNKDVLSTYNDKDIVKVGASKKVEDKFWCEADKEVIRG